MGVSVGMVPSHPQIYAQVLAHGGVNIMRILTVCCFLFIVGWLYISSAQ